MCSLNKIVASIYYHPEAYPPTLNAIDCLSTNFDITLLYRPHLDSVWEYPENIHLIASGDSMDIKKQEQSSSINKIFIFLQFMWRLRQIIIKNKPNIVLLYDSIPLFAFYLINWTILHKPFIWYHSHDISEKNKSRRFSIGWLASKYEYKLFKKIQLFTLPALERLKYFPLDSFKGDFMFLPNLPNKKFYSQFFKSKILPNKPVKLIYQGSISEGHALENIIKLLPYSLLSRKMELHLVGRVSDSYKSHLNSIAETAGVLPQLIFHDFIPFRYLPSLTVDCDIGVAIHEPLEIIYQTGGTASNKIYEYAACGLPVLYYRNEHYLKHLSHHKWAIPTEINDKSILDSINYILENYESLSKIAKNDFLNTLHYENYFEPVLTYLTLKVNAQT